MEIIASYRVSQRQNHFTSHQQEEIKKLNKEGKRVINLGRGNPVQLRWKIRAILHMEVRKV